MNPAVEEGSASIQRIRGGYLLESAIEVPRPLDEVFAFFSNARNLPLLTPPMVHFEIENEGPIDMAVGTEINYRLRVRGIPLRWRSEITIWEPPFRFADVQVKGPYRRWIHEHRFTATDSGTLCEDRVEYSVWGGALVHGLVVKRDVQGIFRFRTEKMKELFSPDEAVK